MTITTTTTAVAAAANNSTSAAVDGNNVIVDHASSTLQHSADGTDGAGEHAYEFVDYIPPPVVKILPPAKYKLWIIVFVLVYFAEWLASEAKLFEFLRMKGWLSPNGTLFLM